MQAAVRFYSGGGLTQPRTPRSFWFAMAHPPRSQGDRSDRLSVNRGDSDQLGKQRCRAADARAELPRIMGEQLKRQCRALPRCLYRLRHGARYQRRTRCVGLAFAILLFTGIALQFSAYRLRVRGTWPMSRLRLSRSGSGCSTSSLTAEVAHNSGLIGLCCFGLRALSLGRVETHALSGNWDRVPSARSAVPRTGNSCCGRRSRLWVRNQFQPPRTTTNEDRDR